MGISRRIDMKKILFPATLLMLLVFSGPAWSKTDIEFVLDASGSMRAAMAGSTQMDVAKQTIKSTIETIPADTNVALRVYAHRVEQADKAGSCVDSELMIPFGPLNKAAFVAKVDSIQPKGYTPIAYSLQQVASDFGVEREAEKVVVLVSDGEETCGGDPVQTVKDLVAKGFKLKLHAVGFNVDAKTQAQLKAIAQAGGGQYYDARDPASLSNSLKKITQEALVVQKTTAVYGSEIKGGDSYETAVTLGLGQEFRLNHHQRVNQFDYFYVDLKTGQALTVTLNTVQKGVTIDGEKANEHTNAYGGFQIHDSSRQKLKDEEIIGSPNATRSVQVTAPSAGRYYVLIGSTYADMHKDHPFKVEVKDQFDAGSGTDAGGATETAVGIEKGKSYPDNYLFSGDEADFFKFNTTKGEVLTVQILPENLQSSLSASFYDDLRVKLAEGASANRGAGFRASATATGPVTYMKVDRNYNNEPTKYSMRLENVPSATTAAAPEAVPPTPVVSQPTAAPTAQKVEEKVIGEPSQLRWMSSRALKGLAIAFGSGAFSGLIGGVLLSRRLRKKS